MSRHACVSGAVRSLPRMTSISTRRALHTRRIAWELLCCGPPNGFHPFDHLLKASVEGHGRSIPKRIAEDQDDHLLIHLGRVSSFVDCIPGPEVESIRTFVAKQILQHEVEHHFACRPL